MIINGGMLCVAQGVTLNYESVNSYTITVRAIDSRGETSDPRTFTIDVTNIAPYSLTDVYAASNAVDYQATAGTVVGITAQADDVAVICRLTRYLTTPAGDSSSTRRPA